MFDTFISKAQSRLDKRRRYNQAVSEILNLSDREVSDMRADRSQMLHDIKRQFYG